jgi:uncharacterized membrane protein YoaK (UPF0700 family)
MPFQHGRARAVGRRADLEAPSAPAVWHEPCYCKRWEDGSWPAPILKRFILQKLLSNRTFLERSALALVLPFVAGAVNASGFFIVGTYTSHVTGSVARVGDELAQGHTAGALQAGMLVLAFFMGTALATALVERARRVGRAHYVGALMTESLMLLVVTLLGVTEPKHIPFLQVLTTALLCAAMGMQNALVTKLSGAVVRTTHLTGIVTDLGIESVRVWQWLRTNTPGAPLARKLARLHRVPELRRLRLHLAIFSSFLGGAFIGPLLYLRQGFASMLLPVTVLLGLVIFDSVIGLRSTGLPFERQPSTDAPGPPEPREAPPAEGGSL